MRFQLIDQIGSHVKAGFSFFATRRFFPLFGTQFLGAFNDNLLKTAIVVLISFHGLSSRPAAGAVGQSGRRRVHPALLPVFRHRRQTVRRYDKAVIARWIKLAEIAIMLLAGAGFFLHSAGLLLSALFLMGAHSAFFGPLKYSVLPQYLKENELVGGNGLIEMGTFLAILIGQIGGSMLTTGGPLLITATLLATAVLGYGASRARCRRPNPARRS